MTVPSLTNPINDGKNLIYSLSRWRERAGVRVDIVNFPLTLILSSRGEDYMVYNVNNGEADDMPSVQIRAA